MEGRKRVTDQLAILLPAAESHPRRQDSPEIGCTPGPTTDHPEGVADGSSDEVSLTLEEERWVRIVVAPVALAVLMFVPG